VLLVYSRTAEQRTWWAAFLSPETFRSPYEYKQLCSARISIDFLLEIALDPKMTLRSFYRAVAVGTLKPNLPCFQLSAVMTR
jgi:hypothetical protein